ncbi:MAG: aminomethyl-transferring glycine dehydrogenase subunit GcvPA [Promethearchaeota archaeon]|nr:MAG: aminomethyl-transferring glycine dehydrogenase subunit GcvPA [Candidatus Lokiarchaeota archaeon]
MDFVPHDKETINEMLKMIGIKSIEDLFREIPQNLKIDNLNLPQGISEPDLLRKLKKLSSKNKIYSSSFLGAGCYYHYIPSLVDFVISRSEFYTSYTPYQAEASQGLLQAIFEYQSAISRLTAMDVANASMYDGSTALAEAAIISTIITGKNNILILEGVHPEYIEVLKTYCWANKINHEIVSEHSIISKLNEKTASVLFQSPNFFGEIENISNLVKIIRDKAPRCLIIQVMTDLTCLGILKPPGEMDIDIFVAEGQSLGINTSFGGPGLGIFTAKKEFLRKVPGRLIGKTKEIDGEKEGFILTLQTREQHIRREKAISNICTNQSLCSLAALIYLVSLGKTGLREIALQNFQKADYVKKQLKKIKGIEILNQKPTYNEFIVRFPNLDEFLNLCLAENLLPPLKLSYYFHDMDDLALVCVTEMNSSSDIKAFLNAVLISTNKINERL